jgi:glycosyltransferase involved in cell wall biosynthesis
MNVGFSLLTLQPGHVGGSETVVAELLRQFAAARGPERLTVLANPAVADAYAWAETDPVAFDVRSYRPGRAGAGRLLGLTSALLLPRLVSGGVPERVDVVHYPLTVPIPRTRRPTVLTLHDLQHHELPELFPRGEVLFRRFAYDRAAKRASRVVTLTEHTKEHVVDRLGVPRERIDVIPHGVNHERLSPDPEPADDLMDLPERFVFYPAAMWPHKNHRRLMEAFNRLGHRDLSLVLSGQPRGRDDGVTGGHDRVVHLGYVPSDVLPTLYRRARAVVFPSLFEGFGLPVLEAMACGCPVAASRIGPLVEVADGVAVLFDPEDTGDIARALDEVLGPDPGRARRVEDGIRRVAGFSWAKSAAMYRATYERAVAGDPE